MDFTNRIFIVFDVDDVLFAAHSVRAAIIYLIESGRIHKEFTINGFEKSIQEDLGEDWELVLTYMFDVDLFNKYFGYLYRIEEYSVIGE